MPAVLMPIIDSRNPMYCPEITSSRYLRRLKQMRHSSRHLDSFTHSLSLSSHSSHNSSSGNVDTFMFHPTHAAPQLPPIFLQPPVHNVPPSQTSSKRKREDLRSCNLNEFLRLTKRIRSDLSQPSSFILSPNYLQPHLRTLLNAAPSQESSDGLYDDLCRKVTLQASLESSRFSPRRVRQLERESTTLLPQCCHFQWDWPF